MILGRMWRMRAVVCWLGVLVMAAGIVAVSAPVAQAQDEEAAVEEKSDGESSDGEKRSKLMWVIETSGWIGAILLLISMYFVAVVVQLFIQFRTEVAAPPEIVQQCEELLAAKQYQEMYDLLVSDDSFFSKSLSAGIAELRVGLHEARDAMERQADAQTVDMEKKTSILAVIGTVGPMIGLLGTLMGMMTSFNAISEGGRQLEPAEVAKGIEEALLLTFEGVGLSIPAIFFYSFFRNRIASISVNTVLLADKFLGRMGRMSKTKPPGAPATA